MADSFTKDVNLLDDTHQPKFISAFVSIVFICCKTLLWVLASSIILPFFLVGLLVWGLPPTIPVWSRIFRYFKAVFTEGKVEDNIPFTNRVIICISILNVVVKIPANGVCWFLDELLYPDYYKADIKEPVFFLTAPRSGSVQLWQYLEEDKENFIVPTVAEVSMPYIWYWKLFIPILAKYGIKRSHSVIPNTFSMQELKKRVTIDFGKAGIFDGLVGMWHIAPFSYYLGSSFMKWGYSYAKLEEPMDEKFYDTLLSFTSHVVRKVIYLRGKPKQRMLLKVHFLRAAKTLEQQYPKAKFFTVVRQPLNRFQSFINFLKMLVATDGPHGKESSLFPPTWKAIRDYVIYTQIPYCKQEMTFYKDDQTNKLVIPFTMYVNNLSATLRHIYSFCNIPIPDHVVSQAIKLQNTSHDRTKLRASYDPNFDRSLTSLGVDEDKVKEHLADYIEWINQLENCKKFN